MRYFIEQAPDTFYEEVKLIVAKARARRMSRKPGLHGRAYRTIFLIGEEYDPETKEHVPKIEYIFENGHLTKTQEPKPLAPPPAPEE